MAESKTPLTLVSVVVPFYNEEDNVEPLHERIVAVFASLPDYDVECVFVNDGSTDNTRAVLDRLSQTTDNLRALHLIHNCGQSAALVTGLRHARGDYLITLDGDLQNDPQDIPNFLELLKTTDFVCGYRKQRHDNRIRLLSSRIANTVRNWVLHDGLNDASCGIKGLRRKCLPHVIAFNGIHRFMGVVMRAAGMTTAECVVTHHPRLHGVSKYGINNRLWRGLYDLVGVAWLRRRYVNPDIEDHDAGIF